MHFSPASSQHPSVPHLRQVLRIDPIWSAYALADLRADLLPFCRWSVAGDGLALVYTGLQPPILLTIGPAEDVAAALAQAAAPVASAPGTISLPEEVYLSVRHEHLPAVERWYDVQIRRVMVRMALGQEVTLAPVEQPLTRLVPADVPAIEALIALGGPYAPDGFAPYQVEDGFFYGVEADASDGAGGLAAVGGTHILNFEEGVAAIGNVYTRADCRGKGYARAITSEIVAQLRAAGLPTIVLNVNNENTIARNLYDSLGFVEHCSFVEGSVKRSANDSE
ncbi:MAG: GNAT family N-acetyltransferase [Chloroflexi bacterium]|nr:MAG: GNAT family N-acetyltransferase [Chloroflexota bacterium]